MLENSRVSNSGVFRGVLSKSPTLNINFSNSWTAIYPLDKSYPLFEQLVPELQSLFKHYFAHILNSRQ